MAETFYDIQDKLINYPRFRKEPGFDTVKKMLERIGYKDDIPFIHIAGTNGKGSVLAMLSSILEQKNLRVGRFISPHLIDIRERMTVDGDLMAEETFVKIYNELVAHVDMAEKEGMAKPTYFEWLYLMAVMYFMEECPDVIIFETGIGGRLDTTNVLDNKILSVITRIGLDHTYILGDTLEAIAKEKAGIIRASAVTVFYNEKESVSKVIEEECERLGSKGVRVLPFDDKILKRDGESIDFSGWNKYYNYEDLRSDAVQDYRLTNAQIAITAARELSDEFDIDSEDIIKGLAAYKWPGRMDYITEDILVDGAHNQDGMAAFVDYLNVQEKKRDVEILFACMPDKDLAKLAELILKVDRLQRIYIPVTAFVNEDSASLIVEQFRTLGYENVKIVSDLGYFIRERIQSVGARTLLGCVGSLYLIGEILKIEKEGLT